VLLVISAGLDVTEQSFAVLYVSIMGLSPHVVNKRQFFLYIYKFICSFSTEFYIVLHKTSASSVKQRAAILE